MTHNFVQVYLLNAPRKTDGFSFLPPKTQENNSAINKWKVLKAH